MARECWKQHWHPTKCRERIHRWTIWRENLQHSSSDGRDRNTSRNHEFSLCVRDKGVLENGLSLTCIVIRGIFTYGGRGLSKDGIDIANHAVLYNEKDEPSMRPDEPDLDRQCLAVKLRRPQDKLDPMSRINFGKIHTIEHNIPVKPIGMIAESSMAYFNEYAHAGFTSINWD